MKGVKGFSPFGVVTVPKLVGFPKGKMRIRLRNDDFVTIFIRTKHRFLVTVPIVHKGNWHYCPSFNSARNAR